jgi:hypothetical protein
VMYNGDRPHQALENKTPDEVYRSASGGRRHDRGQVRRQAGTPSCALLQRDCVQKRQS